MSEWEWRDRVNESLARLEVETGVSKEASKGLDLKLDRVLDIQHQNTASLVEHIRRTEINEEALKILNKNHEVSMKHLSSGINNNTSIINARVVPLERHTDRVIFLLKALKYVAGLSGLIGAGTALYTMLG